MTYRERCADRVACRSLLETGSQSFALAARLLPRAVRDDATALYAFCRVADDAIDESVAPREALDDLQQRLDAIAEGRPQAYAVDRAVADVVARRDIPVALLASLVEGLSWDVTGHAFDTPADTKDYAVRVAATVGLMMTCLMGIRDADTLTRAGELGMAMQMTNIARDVAADGRQGRCYVPARQRLKAFGHERLPEAAEWSRPEGRAMVAALLAEADAYYGAAWSGIQRLPRGCRTAIRAAALIYREIGQVIAARGHDASLGRAVVPRRVKWRLAVRAMRAGPGPNGRENARPTAPRELQRLVALCQRPARSSVRLDPKTLRWWQLVARWAWVVELFGELAERERLDSPREATSNEISGSISSSPR